MHFFKFIKRIFGSVFPESQPVRDLRKINKIIEETTKSFEETIKKCKEKDTEEIKQEKDIKYIEEIKQETDEIIKSSEKIKTHTKILEECAELMNKYKKGQENTENRIKNMFQKYVDNDDDTFSIALSEFVLKDEKTYFGDIAKIHEHLLSHGYTLSQIHITGKIEYPDRTEFLKEYTFTKIDKIPLI